MCSGSNNELDNTYELVGIHLTIEWMNNMFIVDAKPRGLNANNMLKHLREATEEYKQGKQFARDIEFSGDIDTLINCNIWHDNFNNALSDLQDLYSGAEVRRKGFNVALLYKTGRYETQAYEVNYAENLKSCNIECDFNNVIYGLLPKGYDSLYGDIQYSKRLESGVTVEKEYNIRVKESDTEEEDESYVYFNSKDEAIKELNKLAKMEFDINKIDEPTITYDINYLDLSLVDNSLGKTYLQVGDLVRTNIQKLNLSVDTRVMSFNYNLMTDRIEDVTLSNNAEAVKVPTTNTIANELEKRPTKEESTSITKLESTNILNSGLQNSYVTTRKIYSEDGKVTDAEILMMDSPSLENAQNVWRWNKAGLMFSPNGYNGVYQMGMRYDGVIFADLIKAGMLQSLNNKSWINMEDGTFNLANVLTLDENGNLALLHSNGESGVTLNRGGLRFTTNSTTNGMEDVAELISTSFSSNRDMNGLSICTTGYGDYIQVGYKQENGSVKSAMYFVPAGVPSEAGLPFSDAGIYVKDKLYVNNTARFDYAINIKSNGSKDNAIYNDSNTNYLNIYGDNGINFGFYSATTPQTRFAIHESPPAGSGDLLESWGNLNFHGYTLHNLSIQNATNTYANSETKTVAEVSALETNFSDNIRYIYKDITSKDNKIILNIPSEYVGRNYIISGVAKKGFGDYAIVEENDNRFIIETDREMTMNIEISIE